MGRKTRMADERHEADGIGTALRMREYFNGKAERWDDHPREAPGVLRRILDACGLRAGQKVLDAACGTGVLFPHLLAANPARLVGVDVADAMTYIARQKYNDSRLDVVTADLLLFTESGFDRVVLYNAYPHFPDKPRLARKLHDLLAANGRFVIAHGAGREQINAMHASCGAEKVSVALREAREEAQWFSALFSVDLCTDADDVYILSGIKKAGA